MHSDRPSSTEVHDASLQRLRQADHRYTSNRRRIVQALHESTDPQTIADLLDATRDLAQSSAYRNLGVLETAGVVHRIVTTDDHARFELTEDITGAHHHHLVCTDCGDVLDIGLSDALEQRIHDELTAAAESLGFIGAHHRIDLIGSCSACSI